MRTPPSILVASAILLASAFAVSALALAGCQPKDQAAVPPPAVDASVGCNVHIEKDWINQETPLRRYTSEATSMGPTCDEAVATLAVRAREGSAIFVWSGITAHLFGLSEAKNASAMKTAMISWVDQSNSSMKTSDQFPVWEETDGQSKADEFPMHPEAWYDAQAWEAMRKEKLDVFCFPQGMESLNCAVLRDGQMETVGLQQFPG